jgi:hypothetical protein
MDFFVAKPVITALVAGAHSHEPFAPLHKRFAFAAGNGGADRRALLAFFLAGEGGSTPRPYFHGRSD